MNKVKSPTYISPAKPKSRIRPTVMSASGNDTDSHDYRLVLKPLKRLKIHEYLFLPHSGKNLKIDQTQIAYRTATGCLDAISILRETVSHYNREDTDVLCVIDNLPKAYDRINISSISDILKTTSLPV